MKKQDDLRHARIILSFFVGCAGSFLLHVDFSLVAASGGYSPVAASGGCSLVAVLRLLLFWNRGSRASGLQ